MSKLRFLAVLCALSALAGCQATGEQYRSDVYTANDLNTAQQVQSVEIIAIQPAKVALNNSSNQTASAVAGGVLGAVLGGVIGHQIDHWGGSEVGALAGGALGAVAGGGIAGSESYVNGVQLTFKMNGRIFNSVQVGQMCEYKYGPAIMVSTNPTSTRIQPNNPYGCQPNQ